MGTIATIIDEGTGAAVTSSIEASSAPTVSPKVEYLHAIPIGGTYTAVGEIVRMGRAMAIADARILNEEGKLLARGTCIYQIPRLKQGPAEQRFKHKRWSDPKGARWTIRDLDDVREHVGDSPNFQTLYIDPGIESELVETHTCRRRRHPAGWYVGKFRPKLGIPTLLFMSLVLIDDSDHGGTRPPIAVCCATARPIRVVL